MPREIEEITFSSTVEGFSENQLFEINIFEPVTDAEVTRWTMARIRVRVVTATVSCQAMLCLKLAWDRLNLNYIGIIHRKYVTRSKYRTYVDHAR